MDKQRLILLLVALLLGGCAPPSFTTELPTLIRETETAMPVLSPSPTPTPSPTPSPSPTPTPTPAPGEALASARRAYEIGDWATAEALYRQLLNVSSLTPQEAAEVRLGLGKTLLAAGRPDEALPFLEGVVASLPESAMAAEAHLHLAQVLVEVGEPAQAVPHYEVVLITQPLLAPYVYEWLGDAQRAAGVYTPTLEAYRAARDLATATSRWAFLSEKIALTHSYAGEYQAALNTYDAILGVATIPTYRARIAYQAAETARLRGDESEALRRFNELVLAYPTTSYAYEALVQLVEAGAPVDDLLRGKVDYYAEAYGPAVEAFSRHVNADPEHTGEPHYYAGLSYLEAGSYNLALTEFRILIDTHEGDPYWGSAWMGIGQALEAQGRAEEAIAAYRTLPETLPDHPRAAEALWSAAELVETLEGPEAAAAAFTDLAARYPEDTGSPAARFRAGLVLYEAGREEEARGAWRELLNWYPYDDRGVAARFWLGKSYLEAGNAPSATTYLSETVALGRWDFYGIRAADLLAGRPPLETPPLVLAPCGDVTEQDAVFTWLESWIGLEPLPDLRVPPDYLLDDPRLARGTTLLRVGRFEEGRSELETLRDAYVQDPWVQYHLALIFREAGLFRSSIIAASTVWRLSPANEIAEIPRFLGCLVYPTYFDDLVEREAAEFGFHPLTLYSLLRQESLFEGFATSYAAAHGLMQVIPPTGQEIATALGWPPGYETPDLYRPLVSLRFGSWYLAQQRDRFAGALYPALAGYNGGPGNAARWWETAGEDPDLFVEHIGFQETRTYVRRITEHHTKYRWLYVAE